MVVRSYPTVDKNRPNELNVTIIDSTRCPHANDSRANGITGIGTGTITIVTNTDGNAIGFRWRDGQSTRIEYARIAFGALGPNTNECNPRHIEFKFRCNNSSNNRGCDTSTCCCQHYSDKEDEMF
jgi:hypothetical protein